MKTATKLKKHDAEIIQASDLCKKIICRPRQSRETIPLNSFFSFMRRALNKKFQKKL